MDVSEPQFLEVGAGNRRRRIAYRLSEGGGEGPQLLWLPGFLSDMASTKAAAVAEWAEANALPLMRFDYSGHGRSSGALLEASIGDWLEEVTAVWGLMGERPRIVIGSSMGGWTALLLARQLAKAGRSRQLDGLVLIAPAFDMTEALMWRAFPPAIREEIETEGVTYLPSAYGDAYPITRRLIEEGRNHLIEDCPFDPGCPVRILQGMRDPDVPWHHALALVDLLQAADVELTLIKDADHRQSRPQDLRRLTATVAGLLEP
jgi:pimeloyl-ACP methyl ester carboxylesterase